LKVNKINYCYPFSSLSFASLFNGALKQIKLCLSFEQAGKKVLLKKQKMGFLLQQKVGFNEELKQNINFALFST